MADSYKFNIGNLVTSTKFIYLIKDRGLGPEDCKLCPGQPGYLVFNLTTKSEYWTPRHLAHKKYKMKNNGKAGQVLFG